MADNKCKKKSGKKDPITAMARTAKNRERRMAKDARLKAKAAAKKAARS